MLMTIVVCQRKNPVLLSGDHSKTQGLYVQMTPTGSESARDLRGIEHDEASAVMRAVALAIEANSIVVDVLELLPLLDESALADLLAVARGLASAPIGTPRR